MKKVLLSTVLGLTLTSVQALKATNLMTQDEAKEILSKYSVPCNDEAILTDSKLHELLKKTETEYNKAVQNVNEHGTPSKQSDFEIRVRLQAKLLNLISSISAERDTQKIHEESEKRKAALAKYQGVHDQLSRMTSELNGLIQARDNDQNIIGSLEQDKKKYEEHNQKLKKIRSDLENDLLQKYGENAQLRGKMETLLLKVGTYEDELNSLIQKRPNGEGFTPVKVNKNTIKAEPMVSSPLVMREASSTSPVKQFEIENEEKVKPTSSINDVEIDEDDL